MSYADFMNFFTKYVDQLNLEKDEHNKIFDLFWDIFGQDGLSSDENRKNRDQLVKFISGCEKQDIYDKDSLIQVLTNIKNRNAKQQKVAQPQQTQTTQQKVTNTQKTNKQTQTGGKIMNNVQLMKEIQKLNPNVNFKYYGEDIVSDGILTSRVEPSKLVLPAGYRYDARKGIVNVNDGICLSYFQVEKLPTRKHNKLVTWYMNATKKTNNAKLNGGLQARSTRKHYGLRGIIDAIKSKFMKNKNINNQPAPTPVNNQPKKGEVIAKFLKDNDLLKVDEIRNYIKLINVSNDVQAKIDALYDYIIKNPDEAKIAENMLNKLAEITGIARTPKTDKNTQHAKDNMEKLQEINAKLSQLNNELVYRQNKLKEYTKELNKKYKRDLSKASKEEIKKYAKKANKVANLEKEIKLLETKANAIKALEAKKIDEAYTKRYTQREAELADLAEKIDILQSKIDYKESKLVEMAIKLNKKYKNDLSKASKEEIKKYAEKQAKINKLKAELKTYESKLNVRRQKKEEQLAQAFAMTK